MCGEDKFGGIQININRALEFKACLGSCSFVDLGFAGPKFTWSNKRQITDLVLERIDRFFANPLWRIIYLEAAITHLPRTFSEHHLVLIELSRPSLNHLSKPFQFQSMWLMHPDFPRIMKEAWHENTPYLQPYLISLQEIRNGIMRCLETSLLRRGESWPD